MKRKKTIIAAFAAALMFAAPLASTAQIIKLDDSENQRQSVDGNVGISLSSTTGEPDNFSPMGNGLWVLTASAGLYLLAKARKPRKNLAE